MNNFDSMDIYYKTDLISAEEFSGLFKTFTKEAFRLELLQQFLVPQEVKSLMDFRSGMNPPKEYLTEWGSIIKNAKSRGAKMKRVRLIEEPITEYIKFEILWGYKRNVANGEEIRYIKESIYEAFKTNVPILKDFWLFDEKICCLMEYDLLGKFLGVRKLPDEYLSSYIALKNEALLKSLPIQEFKLWKQ